MRTEQLEPKPFSLVPIPTEAPKRSKAVTFEKFRGLTGQMDLEFEVVSEYLFVGSGGYEFDPNAKGDRPDVWHTFYRRNGQICIPGTSLKGSIRAIVEAISNSCVSQTRRSEQVRSKDHQRCEFKSVDRSQLCPSCRLFGTTGLRGRANFTDAMLVGNVSLVKVKIAELWEPRRAQNARRFYEVKAFQRLPNQQPERNCRFVEAVPKGTKFRTILCFENLDESELGLIFHALGWKADDESFTPKLGGAKPRCFGAVKFEPKQLRLWKMSDLTSLPKPEVKEGDALIGFVKRCMIACQNSDLLHKPSWETFVHNMKPKSDACPRGNY